MEEMGLEHSLEGVKDLDGGRRKGRWEDQEPVRSLARPSGDPLEGLMGKEGCHT